MRLLSSCNILPIAFICDPNSSTYNGQPIADCGPTAGLRNRKICQGTAGIRSIQGNGVDHGQVAPRCKVEAARDKNCLKLWRKKPKSKLMQHSFAPCVNLENVALVTFRFLVKEMVWQS